MTKKTTIYPMIIHEKSCPLASEIAKSLGAEKFFAQKNHFRITVKKRPDLKKWRKKYQTDINFAPDTSTIKLLVSDMDSTLINIESIDEMADLCKRRTEVAKITEDAMTGKINFDESLKKRVALLAGLPVSMLEKIYRERLFVNPGGRELLAFCRRKNIKTALVSGGFDYFSKRLKRELKIDAALANRLEIENGKLTGRVAGKIVNAQAKADFVRKLCRENHLEMHQTIAIGDGANDLLMMKNAGVSVAYRAKAVVAEATDIVLDHGGLDKIIDFFG